MAEPEKPASPLAGLPAWAKVVVSALGLFGLVGGGGGAATYFTADKARESIETRLSVAEVRVGNAEVDQRKGEATNALILAKLDIIASRLDQSTPVIDELKRRNAELTERLDRAINDSKEARKDIRSDMGDRMDNLDRRLERLEQRFMRLSTGVGPIRPPDASAEIAPFAPPGATEGVKR